MSTVNSLALDISCKQIDLNGIVYPDGYFMQSAFCSQSNGADEQHTVARRVISAAALAAGWSDKRANPRKQPHGARAAYDAICAVINLVMTDSIHRGTDHYAAMVIEALGGVHPHPQLAEGAMHQ